MYKNNRIRHNKGRKHFGLSYWIKLIASMIFWLWMLSVLIILLLRFVPPPTTSFMMQTALRNGLYAYQWQPYEQISPSMALAAIAAEDQRFPTHNGFDLDAINEAIADAQRGAGLRGASTITQQVAKNIFLWPGGGFGIGLLRKGIEAWLAFFIELTWSKQRILEMYLNIAQFSDRTFGVEAASRQFLQVSARDLTASKAAMLAAVLPGPELYDLAAPSAQVFNRQDWILVQMNQLGGEAYLQQLYE